MNGATSIPRLARVMTAIPLLLGFAGCATHEWNPSFPIAPQQAERAIDQMQHHRKRLARPVVLVGGFLDPGLWTPVYAAWIRDATDDATIVSVSLATCGSFDACRRRIINAVDRAVPTRDPLWTGEVDVIGVSLGGLAARYAAAPSDNPSHARRLKIARLFTISSPLAGAALAKTIALTDFQRQMRPGSQFLQTLAEQDVHSRYAIYPYVILGDEIVGQSHAAPPYENPFWLSSNGLFPHESAEIDPRIFADICRRLRYENPFTKVPASPLPRCVR